jgi:hypothetical protein
MSDGLPPNNPGEMPEDSLLTAFAENVAQAAPQPPADFEQRLALRLTAMIQQQKEEKPTMTAPNFWIRQPRSLRIGVLIMLILLLITGVTLAVNSILEQFIRNDAGLSAVYDADKGIPLQGSQTVGAYSIDLEWGYADGNRLTLAFTFTGADTIPQGFDRLHIEPTLWDADQQQIPMIDGRANDGNIESHLYNFDLSGRPETADPLQLRLRVEVYGDTITGTDPANPNISYTDKTLLGEINLDFSLPRQQQVRKLTDPIPATDQDTIITLRQVVVTPAQTRFVICYPPPAPERQWIAIPVFQSENGDIPGGGAVDFTSGVGENTGDTCNAYIFNAAMFDYHGTWSLEIRELVGMGSGGGNDQQRIAGSWKFTFTVP